MVTIDELSTETLRLRKLRHIVDISSNLIMQGSMSRVDAERLVRFMRERILALFPAGDETYEIVYAHRFRRLIDEFAVPSDRLSHSDTPS